MVADQTTASGFRQRDDEKTLVRGCSICM